MDPKHEEQDSSDSHPDSRFDFVQFLPLHICEHIADFLHSKGLINAASVSQDWQEVFGSSNAFRKCVKVQVYSKGKGDIGEVLRSSARNYKNLKLFDFSVAAELSDTMAWKNVELFNSGTVHSEQLYTVLKSMPPPSLEKLNLNFICEQPLEFKDCVVTFPVLKELYVNSCRSLEPLTTKQPMLQKLVMRRLLDQDDAVDAQRASDFLAKNCSISKLWLTNTHVNADLQLQELVVNTYHLVAHRPFIVQQLRTLEHLMLVTCVQNCGFFDMWNKFGDLHSLVVMMLNSRNCEQPGNQANKILRSHLKLRYLGWAPGNRELRRILPCVPNIEVFFTLCLTEDVMEACARNLKKLKLLAYIYTDIKAGAQEYYNQLKITEQEINCNIKFRKIERGRNTIVGAAMEFHEFMFRRSY